MTQSKSLFDQSLLESIHQALKSRGETLAVAESVTSGLLQFALGQAEFASEFYQGGITVYNLGQKYKHLQVEPIHAQAVNSVSAIVAQQMAAHVCHLFNSHWGIGITGYNTPVPESDNKVFAFYSIVHNGKTIETEKLSPRKTKPFDLQLYYAQHVINRLAVLALKKRKR
jgi:nicotinamide-nucleotide amidase